MDMNIVCLFNDAYVNVWRRCVRLASITLRVTSTHDTLAHVCHILSVVCWRKFDMAIGWEDAEKSDQIIYCSLAGKWIIPMKYNISLFNKLIILLQTILFNNLKLQIRIYLWFKWNAIAMIPYATTRIHSFSSETGNHMNNFDPFEF